MALVNWKRNPASADGVCGICFSSDIYILIGRRDFEPVGSQILTFLHMDNRFLRPLLIVEFLIAVEAIFTVWSEVGGQYHLDLMFWPWKLGIGIAAAGLIVAITANLVRNDGSITRRAVMFCSLLIAIFLLAGVVTYYYHVNEPVEQEEDQDDDSPAKISKLPATRSPAL